MTLSIHPTACIASDVTLGENISIGPFVVIESHVSIGDGCRIGSHCVIQPYVKMGKNNVLHPHVVLGDLPQDTGFQSETVSWLLIGDNNVFREGFTAHRSSKENGETRIGSGCFLMNNSHVAHDCLLGDGVIFANNVAIGGHVEVGDKVFMGGNVVAHQFCRVGAYAIVQGTTGLSMDVLPFTMIGGHYAKHFKLNTVGLRRAGITGNRYQVLASAFRLLRDRQPLDGLEETEELIYLKNWMVAKTKRGIHGFLENTKKMDEAGD
ncbi:MAG: acyl-ACP--UDP-N-acetylglucosamine O-acyltransferase [Gammaproteobacteria bacterium]|nr:acyl-ACP--UDP-N-acetylglucosamine O-acyltransferase [Gammaproteobacteria bacterium]